MLLNRLFGPKHFYKSYVADSKIYHCNIRLAKEILSYNPKTVFEFGCGVGKNLNLLGQMSQYSTTVEGIDISPEAVKIARESFLNVNLGTEEQLKEVKNHDVAFTCSVLDHIRDIDSVIIELKRIASKAVILLETNDVPAKFYYPHDYEGYGFIKTGYEYKSDKASGGDGAVYYLYKWEKR